MAVANRTSTSRPQPGRRSRIRGAVLGAAIGDALGHPTEFLSAAEIRRRFPPAGVTGFEEWWECGGRRFAPYTDDTQMAEIVLQTLVTQRPGPGDLDTTMEKIGRGFAEWRINPQDGHRSPGNACMRGSKRLAEGAAWHEAGGERDGGCGSVMRAYPFGLLFADDPERAVAWAVEHSKLTHRDPIALAACAAMATGMVGAMEGALDIEAMAKSAARHDERTAEMMADALRDGRAGEPPEAMLGRLEGWAAHEAIAAAVYIVARHPRDIRAALLEGANATGDSDSIATIAGALLGAQLGFEALPTEWVRDLERSNELRALADEAAELV